MTDALLVGTEARAVREALRSRIRASRCSWLSRASSSKRRGACRDAAGRTRSLIGAQSLVNARLPNPVAALRHGTIGWPLAGFEREHGQQRRPGPVSRESLQAARADAQRLARDVGHVRPVACLTRAALPPRS